MNAVANCDEVLGGVGGAALVSFLRYYAWAVVQEMQELIARWRVPLDHLVIAALIQRF
jgi:hypothetical protein